jgi:G2/mitotic-specific cyclin 2
MPDPNYMANQTEITWKMRSVLIDWLVEVHWKLKLLPETLFLTVNLIDRFLTLRSVSLAKFQLVGITATLIASKYEEILSPSVSNFVYLSDGSYDEQEILNAECYMLNSLQFVLSSPNPYVFLRRISKADNYDVQTRTLSKYFLETMLLEPLFLKFRPSQLSAASILLARKMLNKGDWVMDAMKMYIML